MNSRYNSFLQFIFSLFDLLSLNLVYVITLFSLSSNTHIITDNYLVLFITWNILWLISSILSYLYINVNYFKHNVFITRSFRCFLLFTLFLICYTYFYPFIYSRRFLLIIMSAFTGSFLFSRLIFLLSIKLLKLHEKLVRRVVIIGYNEVAKNLADHYFSIGKNVVIEGFFENLDNVHELSHYPILGDTDDCLDYAINNNISEIYSTLAAKDHPKLYEVAEAAEDNFIRFKFVPDFHLYADRDIHVDYIDDIPILSLRNEPLEDIGNRIKKRTFDLIFSLCVILFLFSWLFPILAILIKLDSKGPVFYNQNRLGRDRNKIKVFKFRTMKTTDSDKEFKQATKDDPRITRIGKYMRKTSIDELPQFFNVLLGNMSVVGPRPHPLKMNEDYKRIINKYMIRHFLKPGITGWAQVNGYRGETKDLKDIKGRIEHDIWYMEHWTFLFDLKIISKTVYNVIKGEKNAY